MKYPIQGWFMLLLLGLITIAVLAVDHNIKNSAPQVHIVEPGVSQVLTWGTPTYYSIEVSDQEDGMSRYDEIRNNEVLLAVQYLSHARDHEQTDEEALALLPKALVAISRSTCFDCHRVHEPWIGPSFQEVALRYSRLHPAQDTLVNRIKSGSSGHWGEEKMPPNPDLSPEKIEQMVDWILQQANDPSLQYHIGLEGSFTTPESQFDEVNFCRLTALYQDHGQPKDTYKGQTGYHSIWLRMQ